jgi:hypothetical protein
MQRKTLSYFLTLLKEMRSLFPFTALSGVIIGKKLAIFYFDVLEINTELLTPIKLN